jgi:hypothetical protein
MASASWLFVRGTQSVHLIAPDTRVEVIVRGPGTHGQTFGFTSDDERARFQTAYAQRLRELGWTLEGGERRRARERRATARVEPERRRV